MSQPIKHLREYPHASDCKTWVNEPCDCMNADLHDTLPQCPNCGAYTTFEEHHASTHEPHGELNEASWLTCDACGAYTTSEELSSGIKP